MDSKTSDEKLREEFEAIFPRPRQCEWIGNGFVATDYNAWSAHSHIDRWAGYRAASSARSEEMEALRAVLMRTANALDSATHFVSKEKGVMQMLEVLAAARAALTPTEKPTEKVEAGWQPIETAPKDGTEIILARDDRVTAGHWMEEREELASEYHSNGTYLGQYPSGVVHKACWLSWDGGFTDEEPPTAWQPLPPAPTEKPE